MFAELLQIYPDFFHIIAFVGVMIATCGLVFLVIGMSHLEPSFLILGLVLILVGGGAATWAQSARPVTVVPAHAWDSAEIQNITSLKDGSSYSQSGRGSFILGTGHYVSSGSTYPAYTFYKVMPQGYQIGQLDATNVFVREDEDVYPYVEYNYHHTSSEMTTYNDTGESFGGYVSKTLTATYLHVPNGTVYKNDYKLDAELK